VVGAAVAAGVSYYVTWKALDALAEERALRRDAADASTPGGHARGHARAKHASAPSAATPLKHKHAKASEQARRAVADAAEAAASRAVATASASAPSDDEGDVSGGSSARAAPAAAPGEPSTPGEPANVLRNAEYAQRVLADDQLPSRAATRFAPLGQTPDTPHGSHAGGALGRYADEYASATEEGEFADGVSGLETGLDTEEEGGAARRGALGDTGLRIRRARASEAPQPEDGATRALRQLRTRALLLTQPVCLPQAAPTPPTAAGCPCRSCPPRAARPSAARRGPSTLLRWLPGRSARACRRRHSSPRTAWRRPRRRPPQASRRCRACLHGGCVPACVCAAGGVLALSCRPAPCVRAMRLRPAAPLLPRIRRCGCGCVRAQQALEPEAAPAPESEAAPVSAPAGTGGRLYDRAAHCAAYIVPPGAPLRVVSRPQRVRPAPLLALLCDSVCPRARTCVVLMRSHSPAAALLLCSPRRMWARAASTTA
jgi:hypothetical protein